MKSVRAKLIEFSQIDYIQEKGKKREEKKLVLNALNIYYIGIQVNN